MKLGLGSKRLAVSAGSIAATVAAILGMHSSAVRADEAQEVPARAPTNGPVTLEEVIVTGYRKSLNAALDTKRDSIGAVDQIVAEDIAAFPELNLAESIQRIPGVSISRDAGEGRQISVRGLGPQFTRVRINGMEALTTIGTSDANGGTNRDRSFDFNVFASELFNTITVHKTSAADMEEGSLGATVDLRTAQPFDYNGFTFVTGGKLGYNDLASTENPRYTGLISDTFADGMFGALLSVAYSKNAIVDDGSSTVRWQNGLDSSGNLAKTSDFTTLGNNYAASGSTATLLQLNSAFRPRLPRYEEYHTDEKRLGITNSLQFKPSDKTLVSLDSMLAELNGTREEEQLEAPIFSSTSPPGINQVVVQAAQIDSRGNIVSGTFDNMDIRAEHRYDVLNTKFRQHVLDLQQTLTDKLKLNAQVGWAKSEFVSPTSTTLIWDANNVNGYTYDFSNGKSLLPALTYGSLNPSNATAFTLAQIRLRPNGVTNTNIAYQTDLEWTATDAIKLKGGAEFKKYDFSTYALKRASEVAVPASIINAGSAAYATTASLTGLSVPAGTPTSWAVPDIGAVASQFGLYDQGTFPLVGNTGSEYAVDEKDTAAYLKTELTTQLWSLPLRGDLGVRYVRTKQSSTGWSTVGGVLQQTTVEHTYNDPLPSLNLVAQVTDDFLIRLGAAKVMTRPGLPSLNPGANVSISGQNKTVTAGNPLLDPYRANAYDLAFEWYFAKESLLSVAFFYKDIKSFVETVRQTATFNQNPGHIPDSQAIAACVSGLPNFNPNDPAAVAGCLSNWSMSVPVNTPGGHLQGEELSWQQPFSFLPRPFNNFGFIANYTHVTSTVQYFTNLPGSANANQGLVTNTLTGLSKDAANATIYYDNGVWSARVSEAYRGPYLTAVPGNNLNDVEGTKGTKNLDAAASWNIDDHFQLTLEGLNLTNQFQYQYVSSTGNRMNYYHQQGREFFIGGRYKF